MLLLFLSVASPPLLQAADAHKGRKQSAWNTHLHGLLSLTKPKAADTNLGAAEEKQPDNEKPVRDYIIKNFVAEEGACVCPVHMCWTALTRDVTCLQTSTTCIIT